MEDGETWCCLKPYHPPYYERNSQEIKRESVRMDIEDIKKLPILLDSDRLISKETREHFRVRAEVSESDGVSITASYYPITHKGNLVGYKVRKNPKKFSIVGSVKGIPLDFFGQKVSPKTGKKLIITGGEEDALAAYEMLKDRYPEYEPAVVSVPTGEGNSTETFTENQEFFAGFDEIILMMDNDEAGKKAIGIYAPIVGEKARIVSFSEKDASDMKVKGKHQEFINAYFKAREYRPAYIVSVGDILEKAVQPRPWGLSYPWEQLTQLTYGVKPGGEIIGIGAAPGAGKSSLVRLIQEHLMFVHGERIAVFDIEERAEGALNHLIGGMMNLPIHKPDCTYDINRARELGQKLEGKVEFYDGLTEDWEEVKANIRYFASKGIRIFFIDPLSALIEHLNPSDGNQELGKIMRDMRRFRTQQGLTFFHVNHLNNPQSGKDHGAGGDVYGSQFSGSRAQWKYSTALWGLVRDQLSEDPMVRNQVKLTIIKDRLGGNTGSINLQYDRETGRLVENYEF